MEILFRINHQITSRSARDRITKIIKRSLLECLGYEQSLDPDDIYFNFEATQVLSISGATIFTAPIIQIAGTATFYTYFASPEVGEIKVDDVQVICHVKD